MARISASIPEDLKDELYQAASDSKQPISHIIVEALRAHLGGEGASAPAQSVAGTDSLHQRLDALTHEVQGLKDVMTSRTPPRGVRYF